MRPILLALLLAFAVLPAQAQPPFPRQGVPEVPNGIPDPFAGYWSVGFPKDEGVIFSEQIVSCDNPVGMKAGAGGTLRYAPATGDIVAFDLLEFEGRTSWLPEQGESSIAVWLTPDSFYLYPVSMTGSARWDDPRLYERCTY